MTIEKLLSGGMSLMTIVGALAILVSIVVQFTKELVPDRVPTKFFVLVVSVLITIPSTLAYLNMKGMQIKFYLIVGSIALSFVVAFVSAYGWDEFKNLKDRFLKK